MTFRIAFLVDDKNLVPVLRFLSGKVLNMEPPVPVIEQSANGDGRQRACDLFLAQLNTPQFHVANLRAFLPTIGHSEKSTSTQLSKLLIEKRVRRVKGAVKGTYEVVK